MNVPLADDANVKIKRNTDSAINIAYVLAFIASGDGGAEAARLLGLCGLANSTTMQSRSFGNIEKAISLVLQNFAEKVILENLSDEAEAILGDQTDENNNCLFDLWKQRALPRELWPQGEGCADMGWQQKGSGRRRNSMSGHAFFFGMRRRKIIAKDICSKGCQETP